jgi:hypothetical protein
MEEPHALSSYSSKTNYLRGSGHPGEDAEDVIKFCAIFSFTFVFRGICVT